MIKIAFIGAGSIEFTRNVATDLCGFAELSGQLHLSLHDISAERLAFAERLVNRIVEQTGASVTVTASLERTVAIEGAKYVINEVQVGGYDATRLDFDIPAKFGLRQTIGDTIGIGGIFRGLRTIPVAVALATDMLRHCPDAYLLNYTNPMAMLPWAIYAGTEFERVYGLCHSVRDTHAFLAGLVGVPEAEISYTTAGFNHQAFVLQFERNGESLYPKLTQVIDADPDGLGRRVRVELFRRFGYFPTESSEHSAEYVPWFMRHDSQVAHYRIFVGDYLGAGVNHQAWILRFARDGVDLYPRLDEAIERDPELRRRVRVEMYRRLGYFPTESSEHSAEYLPWFMRSDEMIERFRVPVDEYVRRSEENLELYAEMRRTLAEGGSFEIERSL
ncbi:MAG TPA: hypothetical protein VF979_01435, partial [Streptosporangiaceae bacterium]